MLHVAAGPRVGVYTDTSSHWSACTKVTVHHENDACTVRIYSRGLPCVAIATEDLTSGGCHRKACDTYVVLWINPSARFYSVPPTYGIGGVGYVVVGVSSMGWGLVGWVCWGDMSTDKMRNGWRVKGEGWELGQVVSGGANSSEVTLLGPPWSPLPCSPCLTQFKNQIAN